MTPRFTPGARLSILDVSVIIVAAFASVILGNVTWWWGAGVAFVVLHFFLFCNVIRMARPLELIWAAIFTSLAAMTITTGTPSPPATAALSFLVTLVVVAIEMRKPSYHGLGWRTINPDLPNWWNSHCAATPAVDTEPVTG